jgi:hypothetical protein
MLMVKMNKEHLKCIFKITNDKNDHRHVIKSFGIK